MRITKKGHTKLLLSCLISTLCISGLQAEPTLAPVAEVNLNEAPPPWAARPDARVANYSDQAEITEQHGVSEPIDTDLNVIMPLPAIPAFDSPETEPLTLEDQGTGYKQEISLQDTAYQQVETSQEQQAEEKKSLLGKLFSRKKQKKHYQQATSIPSGIENWYQNRNNNALANISANNIEAQAAQGDSDAQYQLGLMYRSGTGVEENVYQAIHWLTRAANANNSQAQYALAMIFRENATQAQDEQKAVSWYQRAAQSGHADAQYSLGLLYANGDSVQQDSGLAKKWFKKSADQGNMAAKIAFASSEKSLVQIASAPIPSEPIEIPVEMSFEAPMEIPTAINNAQVTELTAPTETRFIEAPAAISTSNTIAKKQTAEEPQEQIRVASITAPTLRPQIKNTVKKTTNETQTVKQPPIPSVSPSGIKNNTNHNADSNIDTTGIRQAAMAGDAESQLLYGSLHEDGKGGLEQNYKEAAFWYEKSADQGYAKAQYNLGLLHEDGKGTDQDYYEASQWYKRASNNGFSEAQNNLGVLYIMGKGVIKDRNRAELMFRRASEQGNANAERNLEMLLESTPE